MKKVTNMPMKMNLQFFSEDAVQAGVEDQPTEIVVDDVEAPPESQKTFTQADIDKVVSDRLKRERSKWEKETEVQVASAKTEAEKLAKMTAEQKAEHERQKAADTLKAQQEEYAKRLAELTEKELRIEAHKTLTEKGLPVELLDVLHYGDADSCNSTIEALEKAFRKAVEDGVNTRLRTTLPKAPAGKQTTDPFLQGFNSKL